MVGAIRSKTLPFVLSALLGAAVLAPAQAATITSSADQPTGGVGTDLSGYKPCGVRGNISAEVGTFSGSGPAGSGSAACGDTTTVQVKNEASPDPYGRFNPEGGSWLDSNDLKNVEWNLDVDTPVKRVTFALTDARDQRRSHFEIAAGGDTWTIDKRQENSALQWITILFNEPKEEARVHFSTRHNDGFGISNVKVSPVPVPPALLLMGSGMALLAAVRRRRSRTA